MTDKRLTINFTEDEPELTDLMEIGPWGEAVTIQKYWSGEAAPEGRHFSAMLLWSERAFIVCFDAASDEAPVVSSEPDTTSKVIGLWDRDVCEIFVAPDASNPQRYFEFEVAPTGEWLDVAINLTSGERVPDWEYHSGMEAAAKIENGRVLMAIKIPWNAFGKRPEPGDVWLGNLFRCVGKDPDRGYLAWRPTMTEMPNFHVPKAFGEFQFVK